jgi:trehalose 6-phosphate synthase/phosphatase
VKHLINLTRLNFLAASVSKRVEISRTDFRMKERETAKLIEDFRKASHKLMLFDYDGTLVNYTPVPETALLPESVYALIERLATDRNSTVFIITGRGYRDIENLVEDLPVNIIAEHGAMIRENGVWKRRVRDDGSWKKSIFPIFRQITLLCQDSFIEEKAFSLTWHYRSADPDSGYLWSRELISLLNNNISILGLKLLDGNKVVEVMKAGVGKGKAVRKLVEGMNYDFILSAGDDVTDEEMFEFFLSDKNAFTIKVGTGSTFARYRLTCIDDVVSLLKQLSE